MSALVRPIATAVFAVVAVGVAAVLVWRRTEAAREERKAFRMLPHFDIKTYNDLFLP